MKRFPFLGFTALILWISLNFSLAATFGPGLQETLAGLSADDEIEIIVTFEGAGPLTSTQIDAVRATGATGVYFQELPIMGVLATPNQIDQISQLSGLRSLWLNEQLEYENNQATALTGVDRSRTDAQLQAANAGIPFSGRGVGVMINDSGVDGLHPDLRYPNHLKANVAGQLNLHAYDDMLPHTPQEGVANTDIGGGHGTHVAGIIGATGQQSSGVYEGVAPGADLIGYGSGAGLFILDTLGAFDWALAHQFQYNIRVISNSFGSPSDIGSDFNPDHPTNVATKKCADHGMVVVFSAGNSGSGEGTITGNFKKAPWVITVAAGDFQGLLADFSSRGLDGNGGSVEVDGTVYEWVDAPAITAPGVDIISARASTSALAPLSAQDDVANLPPASLPYYTIMSGTSMACPHVSGIAALMLEADPSLDVYQVKQILRETATNMPGYDDWEAGAGYANAYAAVASASGLRTDFGSTVNAERTFNANAQFSVTEEDFQLAFDPTGVNTQTHTFQVTGNLTRVAASTNVFGNVLGNLLGLAMIAPDGTRHTSGIPVLFAITYQRAVVVDNPMLGTWTVELYGFNGLGEPETTDGQLRFFESTGFTGVTDIDGHPAESAIQIAIGERLADSLGSGRYKPDRPLKRKFLAEYLVMGAGIRQYLPLDGVDSFPDAANQLGFAEAVSAQGAAMRDIDQLHDGVILPRDNGDFDPNGRVTRLDLAYALVQSLGLQDQAQNFSGSVQVEYNGDFLTLEDDGDIPADRKGYVQLALDLGIMHPFFELVQDPYSLEPTILVSFQPDTNVTRGEFAVAITRYHANYAD